MEILSFSHLYPFYLVAPIICTDGGNECDANAEGLTVCSLTKSTCIGE